MYGCTRGPRCSDFIYGFEFHVESLPMFLFLSILCVSILKCLFQAPEVIMRRGTSKAADYWALGVLIFEMLVGDPPFKSISGDPWDTFRRTLSGRFYVPNFISNDAADLIYKLLQVGGCRTEPMQARGVG